MKTLDEYTVIANNLIKDIRLPKEPKGLYAPIEYALSSGGKRIRPILTIATTDALTGDYKSSIAQAIGLELFHNFTLLHDDVMDKSDMRRGKPTVHKKWDETTAILSGDAMFSLCIFYLTSGFKNNNSNKILSLFHKTAMEVYDGQQYDMEFEKRTNVSVDEYINMIRLKTSVLLGCASAMGALISQASSKTTEAFYNYGVKLGLAFQLRDDYLDTFGNPNVFGKATGNDILTDKKTWLLIKTIEKDKTGIALEEIANPSPPEIKIKRITNLYKELGVDEDCLQLIRKYSLEAIECLKDISINQKAMNFFKELAISTSYREN